jgi:DtxR family Mn-dependent transcriptional regulator
MEDYLEAILLLQQHKPVARVGEIARRLDVSNPTVTAALKTLAESGFIEHESYGYIQLTPKGRKTAKAVSRRHGLLRGFFEHVLGVPAGLAAEDACRVEHYISGDTVARLARFVQFIDNCPRSGPQWLEYFHCYAEGGAKGAADPKRCAEACVERCLEEVRSHGAHTCGGEQEGP